LFCTFLGDSLLPERAGALRPTTAGVCAYGSRHAGDGCSWTCQRREEDYIVRGDQSGESVVVESTARKAVIRSPLQLHLVSDPAVLRR
jgi:hypothetical protein